MIKNIIIGLLIILSLTLGGLLLFNNDEVVGTTPVAITTNTASLCPYGLSIHENQLDLLPEMQELGVCSVRTDLYWDWVENSNGYYWGFYDTQYEAYINAGMKPLFILNNANSLYGGSGNCWPTTEPEFSLSVQKFGQFAYTAAQRYPQADFEIQNEKNNADTCGNHMTPEEYVIILKEAYAQIKSANPNALVYAPAVWSKDVEWFEGMYAAGAAKYFDVLTTHPYEWMASPNDPGSAWSYHEEIFGIMDKYCDSDKPVAVGELGTPTGGDGSTTEMGQAEALLETVSLINEEPRIVQLYWYDYVDDCSNTNDRECWFGLTTSSGRKKVAWCAYQGVINNE